MTIKELSQLYHLNREIEMDKRRLDELELLASSPKAQNLDGMPHAPGYGDALARCVAEIVDLKAIISAKQQQCIYERNRLERYISSIPDSLTRQIFTYRFVNGLSWWQVAYSIGGNNTGDGVRIHEHAPTLLTDARIKDINFDLSMAGVKCGFSEGVFVLDGQTGMITATQVEADDRDTIQTIKTDRDALKDAITQALAGADALVTLYNLAPLGEYEVNFNFGDVTYNYEEDKASWRAYVMQGWVPKWMYFVKFEGMSEEEAKAMTAEADAAQIEKAQLFGAE